MTTVTAEEIIERMQKRKISEGRRAGENFVVLDWERKFLIDLLDHSTNGLSVARGNGKTTFLSCLSSEFLDGPLRRPRGEVDLVASSLKQARIAFKHIMFFLGNDGGRLTKNKVNGVKRWRVIDNSHQAEIEDVINDVMLMCLGCDPDRAHGRAPSMILADEPAKWKATKAQEMYNALNTSLGKQPDSKLIVTGTMPSDSAHWFYRMMMFPDAMEDTAVHLYQATPEDEDDVFDEETWRQANPSYDHLPDLRKIIKKEAKNAEQGGEDLSSFKALRLNMGTDEVTASEPLLAFENWQAITSNTPNPRSGPVAIGVDLGGGTSMSAVSYYWPDTGRLESYAGFPAQPTLEKRGLKDGVGSRYLEMHKRGELRLYPGFAMKNVLFLTKIFGLLDPGQVVLSLAADRYKKTDLEQALTEVGVLYYEDKKGESLMRPGYWKIEWRGVGQGPNGGEDVRAFQHEALTGHMSPVDTLIMQSSIKESIIRRDSNGNAALNKARSMGRIDPVQSAILAAGIGWRYRHPVEEENDLGRFYKRALESGLMVGAV